MFNLEYWVGNRKIETLCYNKSKSLCYNIMIEKSMSTHKLGKFKIVNS